MCIEKFSEFLEIFWEVSNFLEHCDNNEIFKNVLEQGSSTRGPRDSCGPPASFVRPGKVISQNITRYEYWSLSHNTVQDYRKKYASLPSDSVYEHGIEGYNLIQGW